MRSAHSLPELANPLEIAVHRGDLDALGPVWMDLVDPSHPGAAFRSWAWVSAWWKTFSHGREPFVLVAREGSIPVAILPLFSEPSALGGRRLAFMGEGIVGSDYLGIACRGQDEQRLARPFAEFLASQPFDELCLDGFMRGDPLLTALEGTISAARAEVDPRHRCPHITLAGDFATYLGELPDGTGQQFKRRLRWLEKQPNFSIDCLTDPDAIVRGLDALFELHHKRWSVEGGSDAIDSPDVEAFHRLAARALADHGWARLYLLNVAGAPRAALYGWRHGRSFGFYQAGYDPEWRQRSVGTVLLGEIVRHCFTDGVQEFDFLRGTEGYKLKWANGWRETVRLRARDASWRALLHDAGRTAYWRLREAGKRALPESALDWARRARKKVVR
ncbi:MAG: cellulose biosynthesis protein CelD [Myxococcales bacterium]|nr:cellulose biosynthesis protein CelD [Myxococcales bacterium]